MNLEETLMETAEATEKMNNIEFDNDTLIELSLFDQNRLKNIKIALITDNNDLRKMNYYLFRDVSDVDHYTMDDLEAEDVTMLDDMDIVIYHKKDDDLKNEILHNIKAKNLKTKFFLITDKEYLRQKDILTEHINGVDKLMKMDFFLEDYILSMEKYLKNNFYSKRVLVLEDMPDVVLYEKELFHKRVENILSRKIFFSLFRYGFDSEIDIEVYNLKKIVRDHDNIFIDKKEKEITFLLLNVIPDFGSKIIKKRVNNFSITLHPIDAVSAFDIVFDQSSDSAAEV